MSKALFQPDVLASVLSKLKTSELEYFRKLVEGILNSRKKKEKKDKEKELLLKLNQTVLDQEKHERILVLSPQVELETISSDEQKELDVLLTESEQLRNQRVAIMIELAHLKSVSLPTIMQELGLKPLQRV
ncbi:MAG: hypothetical protein AAF960_30280 [Bacteroidota bacterium]